MQKRLQESLESKEYKWGHSTHRGFFIGMKLTLALESKTLKPLVFLINEANVSEPKIYPEIRLFAVLCGYPHNIFIKTNAVLN
jgi:hypothetical protein